MSERIPGRGWRRCRRIFRALRIAFVLLLFFVVAAGVYLNEVGLPGFLKAPLLKKLHARGLDLQFTRLRWHLNRGFVAENVRFERAEATSSDPRLSIREVELKVDHAALLKLQWTVDSLILHGGEFIWPAGETNGQPVNLSLTNIQAQLRFLPEDRWALDHFTAAFAGAKLHFSGTVTNASALRDWKFFQGGGGPPELARRRLREFADTLEKIKFFETPELFLSLDGDAREPQTFQGLLTLKAQSSRTPWGSLTNGTLVVRLIAPDATNHVSHLALELRAGNATTPWTSLTNGILIARLNALDLTNYAGKASVELQVANAGTPWGVVRNLQLSLRGVRDEKSTNIIHASLEVRSDDVTTEWARTENASLTVRWIHSLTNAIPLDGTAKLSLAQIHTRWANAGSLELTTRMATPTTNASLHADESWAWWAKLEPYSLDWNCQLQDIHSLDIDPAITEKFELRELDCGGLWRAPQLTLTNLSAELYGGGFNIQAAMDVATRLVTFDCATDFDVQKIAPLLPEKSREWLQRLSWEEPPQAHCTGGVTLPAWTNRQPDWENEVMPALWMRGEFRTGNAAYEKVPVNSVQGHFSLTNVVWELPDLVAVRPEGRLELTHTSDDRAGLYYFSVRSTIDPKAARHLLSADAQRGMDDFVFTAPPKVDAEIWGHWHDPNSVGFKGHALVTNLTFRGESATRFEGEFNYTNKFMNLLNGRIERGARYMTATGLGVDFPGQRLFLTNGFSIMEPTPVAHAISKKVTQTIAPYQFLIPPTVHAHGIIPLVNEVPADLHFQVDGGPFHWMKFNAGHVVGEVHWVGDHMTVTNAQASFYHGNLTGSAAFDFSVDPGTDLAFDTTITNVDLHALVTDLRAGTNRLEGQLSGHLKVTHANSDDWKSWFGSGNVSLRDGLIWDIPIFGRFSPYLDKVGHGLGESRASEGAGKFAITNSIIHSDTLEIRSPTLRLFYHGNVDFDGKVDATMEAEVLRNVPLIGEIVSAVFLPFSKLFESKVTGTLDEPKIEPRFLVPKILLAPFHPFRTLNQIFPTPPNTNTPPGTNSVPPPSPPTPAKPSQ